MVESLVGGSLLAASALAGLAGTPHCAGMCGGFAVACAQRPGEQVAWHAGRLTTYAALGALSGGVGGALPGPSWLGSAVSAALLVWFSLRLGGWVEGPRLPVAGIFGRAGGLLRRGGIPARAAFGALNGLLPCGLVYAALALAVTAGSPQRGALAMLSFGLGTVPGLAATVLGARALAKRPAWGRRALAVGVLALGLVALAIRLPTGDAASPPCHAAPAPAAPTTPHLPPR